MEMEVEPAVSVRQRSGIMRARKNTTPIMVIR